MSDTAIEATEVWKQYRLGQFGFKTFSSDLKNRFFTRSARKNQDPSSEFFWALKDISFSVKKGDIVGLIGSNGAGKSTLLKVLSQITTPTAGKVRGTGRVANLLEVGTGFHPELTGRENIYLNGAIMGMRKAEIARKVDEIIDFSGCNLHIDTPIKRFSSGMIVRLGFAVAAHLECEVMIVDEVLAVGDRAFRNQAVEKMRAVSQETGRTILFVSHNLGIVRDFCHTGLVLESGQLTQYGTIEAALSNYVAGGGHGPVLQKDWQWQGRPQITGVRVDPQSIRTGQLFIEIDYRSPYPLQPEPGVVIYNDELSPVLGTNIRMHTPDREFSESTEGTLRCEFNELPLHDGHYLLSVWLGDGENDVDSVEHAIGFDFVPTHLVPTKPDILHIGALNVPARWSSLSPQNNSTVMANE